MSAVKTIVYVMVALQMLDCKLIAECLRSELRGTYA